MSRLSSRGRVLESRRMATAAALKERIARYEPVIGLEVHCQLKTRTKLFCPCLNQFGGEPNSHVCPVCLGLPGALPVLNRHAVTLALRAALATGCTVQETSIFERKNYFYPDLPKGYQISQYARPLASEGHIQTSTDAPGRVRIQRIHMEEDAGKLLHEGFAWSQDKSGVDFNRSGVPLIEIVSHPDMHGAEEAFEYLSALKAVLVYAEVSDCNMEQGSLRCDANVSVRPRGSETLGTRAEIKNLNSFRNVARAIEHEIARQTAVIESGGTVVQETRLWNADRGETAPMRSKEEAQDYRYFPEPDLAPLVVTPAWIAEVRGSLPELPAEKQRRFVADYAIPAYDARVLTLSPDTAELFEKAARQSGNAKAASNWIMTEVLRKAKDRSEAVDEAPRAGDRALLADPLAANLAELIRLVDSGAISRAVAKDVFGKMWSSGERPSAIVEREGVAQISDEAAIEAIVQEVIAASPAQVAAYRGGKEATLGWFVGQVIRKTAGQANPQLVNRLVKKALAG